MNRVVQVLRSFVCSTSVFGVSTASMQLSFDSRGNSVPTILLMMQRHLYAREGMQVEGIFRITAENSEEEYVREQLNMGVVPDDVDLHCSAGLIKAWFRELPNGLLDSIPPEEVMQAVSEEDCAQLVRCLRPTEAAFLDWAINLMTDVAQLEYLNKMNACNVAMVFAPNMTQEWRPATLGNTLVTKSRGLAYITLLMAARKTAENIRRVDEQVNKAVVATNRAAFVARVAAVNEV
ncbi:hypothetical protein Vadar_019949 [Vaccinium darrowii]|uniref:Uncharacterized protein n=1 Tax=Vaccinium darrowii TaxID=229202 RepID=A0ACB7YXW1_9ERIC|nr:hypothetical protein Vadar_019949 [Vaccinium darrowii]